MNKHTPGPWFLHPKWRHVCANGQMDFVVCQSTDWMTGKLASDEDLANLRLIALAPDLLAIAERWAALDAGDWHAERHASDKRELLVDTRAAIAKATKP